MKNQERINFWLEKNGAIVSINGHEHILKISSFQAIYPYPHQTLHVNAEPIDKTTDYYLEVKRQLKDDWYTDVLGSIETECEVLEQLLYRQE